MNIKESRWLPPLPFFFGSPVLLWQLFFFYLPLLLLTLSSILTFSPLGNFEGLTLDRLLLFLQPVYAKVILSSLLLALSNALICFFIGYPIAYFLAFKAKKMKPLFLFFLIVPFWINFLLHVYAWFFVLEKEGFLNWLLLSLGIMDQPIPFLNSLFAILLMMVYYYLPFMILPLYSSLEQFNIQLIEASQDLGAKGWQTLLYILLPLSKGGIMAGFFLVFIPSFGEFAIPELMGGDKWLFVGNVVSQYILSETEGALGAAFTLVSALALLLASLLLYKGLNFLLKPKGEHA
ncbi:MAG: hypothetical protein A3D18_01545 [Chlamydiae bacterium RIFCSPHIGHO2_02_FULL_49_29]|nr:MAG: hypothetical protein A3D18_01545 [Chlamydiae bacterium RIFCSPHIGHO2_02_FULL_49_29]OGN67812.1 MAG: hypothetical protein A3I15_03725 [Chlamydiae bacterium RIFCSPLOWO2_02_FULL_49_12]